MMRDWNNGMVGKWLIGKLVYWYISVCAQRGVGIGELVYW